jgi:hypothetical protein
VNTSEPEPEPEPEPDPEPEAKAKDEKTPPTPPTGGTTGGVCVVSDDVVMKIMQIYPRADWGGAQQPLDALSDYDKARALKASTHMAEAVTLGKSLQYVPLLRNFIKNKLFESWVDGIPEGEADLAKAAKAEREKPRGMGVADILAWGDEPPEPAGEVTPRSRPAELLLLAEVAEEGGNGDVPGSY